MSLSVKEVRYDFKYGGDSCYAEIYNGDEMVGQVIYNAYLKEFRGVDIKLSEKGNNDGRAFYHYPNKDIDWKEQLKNTITNTLILIVDNRNNLLT